MTVIAVTMVRDEADIIEATLRHTATQVDYIICADNLSTDGTSDILARLADELPLTVVADNDPAYKQADKMTRLALDAMNMGADWVLPFDADELWTGRDGRTVADELEAIDPHIDTVYAAGFDHIATDDTGDLSPWRRADPQPLPKVAFRPSLDRRLAMGNHDVTGGNMRAAEALTYRHFQYRTFDQMARKVRDGAHAYTLTDLPETFGDHWRQAAALDDEGMADRWAVLSAEDGLAFDPPPIHGRRLSVSVVIPAWNLHDLTAQAVESVLATTSAEVVVVDNGSDPPLTFDDGRVTVVRNAANEGFARACNQGAKAASGDLLAFLNNDTIARPGWLDAMTARWCPGLIVGAHLLYPDGGTQHSGVFFRRRAGLLEAFNRTAPAPSGEVPAVTGACLLISADDFDGWDEGFRNAYEDVDLILRHRQAGGRVWFEASAEVTHLESRTPGRFAHVNHNVALLNERWGHLPI